MPLVQEAEKLIETAPLRVKRRGAAEVPFAHERRRIARVAQAVGDGFLRKRQTDARFLVLRADGIELESEPRLVAPGEQCCA
jgi:hypothetical protein